MVSLYCCGLLPLLFPGRRSFLLSLIYQIDEIIGVVVEVKILPILLINRHLNSDFNLLLYETPGVVNCLVFIISTLISYAVFVVFLLKFILLMCVFVFDIVVFQ